MSARDTGRLVVTATSSSSAMVAKVAGAIVENFAASLCVATIPVWPVGTARTLSSCTRMCAPACATLDCSMIAAAKLVVSPADDPLTLGSIVDFSAMARVWACKSVPCLGRAHGHGGWPQCVPGLELRAIYGLSLMAPNGSCRHGAYAPRNFPLAVFSIRQNEGKRRRVSVLV